MQPTDRGCGQIVLGRSSRHAGGKGTANPYASVKFANTTQRTSEVFDTLDPIWPRQEAMFMDVSLPRSELTLPQQPANEGSGASSDCPNHSAAALPTDTPKIVPKAFKRPNAVVSVALFHASEVGKTHKYPTKGGDGYTGDSDDSFLGMASVDLTQLFTGLRQNFDEWLPLSGTEHSSGTVRVVCEYEPSDAPIRVGDFCRFTSYCHPADLFPLTPGNCYQVAGVNGDNVILSYESPEGWVCSFQAHRYALLCEERHHGAVEFCQDELASVTERLSHSPMVRTVAETVERVAVDGLLSVGNDIVHGGLSLFGRWLDGGLETAISDVAHATNWDGRFNPNEVDGLESPSTGTPAVASDEPAANGKPVVDEEDKLDSTAAVAKDATPLPNMPSCPITGEPMIDPVVASDGKCLALVEKPHSHSHCSHNVWFHVQDIHMKGVQSQDGYRQVTKVHCQGRCLRTRIWFQIMSSFPVCRKLHLE